MSTEEIIAEHERKLREERIKTLNITKTIIQYKGFKDKISLTDALAVRQDGDARHPVLSESVSLTDTLRKTEQASGTFVTDTAKVGFADCG